MNKPTIDHPAPNTLSRTDRASLRHHLSAAFIFPPGPLGEPDTKDAAYTRVFQAFDEWFGMHDHGAAWFDMQPPKESA